MQDYGNYSYSRLLTFLEEQYLRRSDKKNYAQYLLTMEDSKSIASAIKIYNKVFKKLPTFIYDGKCLPKEWYKYEQWPESSRYLALELNQCLNENILRLYKATSNPTDFFALYCIVNLRESENVNRISDEISSLQGSDISDYINEITDTKTRLLRIKSKIEEFKNYGKSYFSAIDILLKKGYIKSIVDKSFERYYGLVDEDIIYLIGVVILLIIVGGVIFIIKMIGEEGISVIIFIILFLIFPRPLLAIIKAIMKC